MYLFFPWLNFSHLPSALHLRQYTYRDVFSTAQSRFLSVLMPFSASVIFCLFVSPLPHQQNISLWGLFSSRKQKSHLGRGWVNRESGAWGSCCFWSETAVQRGVDRCARKSLVMKWALWMSHQINSLKPNSAAHHNASWFTDTAGFLEHSPSGGSQYYKGPALQEIILFCFEGCPPCMGIAWNQLTISIQTWAHSDEK